MSAQRIWFNRDVKNIMVRDDTFTMSIWNLVLWTVVSVFFGAGGMLVLISTMSMVAP